MAEKVPVTIAEFFAAMQSGAQSEAEMMALFHEDAVYIEPFSGAPRRHEGKDAIRTAMRAGWEYPLPDMRIDVDRFDVSAESVVVEWTCHSPGLPGGKGSGTNHFQLRDGLIASLETRVRM